MPIDPKTLDAVELVAYALIAADAEIRRLRVGLGEDGHCELCGAPEFATDTIRKRDAEIARLREQLAEARALADEQQR